MKGKNANGWVTGPTSRRPWYFYAFVVVLTIVGCGFAAMIALVIFFGLIAGW